MRLAHSTFKIGDEMGRLCALDRLHVLDTPPEPEFEKITQLVTTCLDVPVSAVSLIDKERQWFKSIQGLDLSQTEREVAFCDHTIRATQCLNIPDATQDPRFRDNRLVTGPPHIRAYLGAPIITPDGYGIGSLCAIDYKVRHFSKEQENMLAGFADVVMNELELRALATSDGLTGLATRRTFVEALQSVKRTSDMAALILIDLDHFKRINDTYGHPTGDTVIKSVADILIALCPQGAIAGRLGGEELGLLLPGATEPQALSRAEIIRRTIEATDVAPGHALTVSASFGVALRCGHKDSESWMAAADEALYAAKAGGRNRVCFAPTLTDALVAT